jgi:hypothetical protein
MEMNKRGVFFTIMVIVLLSLFFISATLYEGINQQKETRKRVETMNSFLFSLEKDLERQLYIGTFRSIFVIEDKIVQTGIYVPNTTAAVQETFLSGTLYGESEPLMSGATFADMSQSLRERTEKIGANTTIYNPTISVTQDDPWHVKTTLTMQLELKDDSGLASWNKTEVITTYVDVQNFEDPLYVVNTQGLVTNKINKTLLEPLVTGSNVANLSAHATGSYYYASTIAPSFISRLEGSTAASPQGIESFVNLNRLASQGITLQDKTVIDYIYFSTQNPTSYRIVNMPSWVKIDQPHLAVYGVQNLTL